MTPGDSEAGTVSVSVTGVVAVVVSSREELMKEVVLEAEGLVVTGVCASGSPSAPSASPSASGLGPEGGERSKARFQARRTPEPTHRAWASPRRAPPSARSPPACRPRPAPSPGLPPPAPA